MFNKNYNTADNELACALLGSYLDNLLLEVYKQKPADFERKAARGDFDDAADWFRLSDTWNSCLAELELEPYDREWLTVENVSGLLMEKGADLPLLLQLAEDKVESRTQKRVALECTEVAAVSALRALNRTYAEVAA